MSDWPECADPMTAAVRPAPVPDGRRSAVVLRVVVARWARAAEYLWPSESRTLIGQNRPVASDRYREGRDLMQTPLIARRRKHLAWGALLLVCMGASAQESPRFSYKPPGGYVPDGATAIKIAVAVWEPIYGHAQIASEAPYSAKLQEWRLVCRSPPSRRVGRRSCRNRDLQGERRDTSPLAWPVKVMLLSARCGRPQKSASGQTGG